MINTATLALKEDCDRKGDWITTFLGGRYYPLDPRPEEVFIENIAHGLSQLCRYGGQTERYYSVGEHSYLLSYAVPIEYAFEALLHDAEEGTTGLTDMCRPVKHQPEMEIFRKIASLNQKVIFEKFGLEFPESDLVKDYDSRIVANETEVLFKTPQKWCLLDPLPNIEIVGYSPRKIEQLYLDRYFELKGRVQNENKTIDTYR